MRECPSCGRLFNADDALTCPDDSSALVAMGEADPLLGRQVGNYRLQKRLGKGGMGAVYEALQPAIGSTVAVKVLHRKYAADPAVVERFFNEARAVNLIGHENIVRIFDFGHLQEGTPYFVMELLRGKPLSALCGTRHSPGEVLPIIVQIAQALGAAHAAGVVHRDLKPDNVFLIDTDDGPRVKVLDFGIAKLASLPGVTHTESGAVLGSARYLSPEQAAGHRDWIGARSDIYSLGVILFELLCGRVPFEATTYGDLLVAHRTQAPPVPRQLEPTIPVWLSNVVLRCLAKQPESRFASMAELIAALHPDAPVPKVPQDWRITAFRIGVPSAVAVFLVGMAWSARAHRLPLGTTLIIEPQAEAAPVDAGSVAIAPIQPVVAAMPPQEAPAAPPVPAAPDAPVPQPKPVVARKPAQPRYTIPEKVGDGMIEVEW